MTVSGNQWSASIVILIVIVSGCSSLPIISQNESTSTPADTGVKTPIDTPAAIPDEGNGKTTFQLTSLDVVSPVEQGDTVEVTATIENRGDKPSEQNVSLLVEGRNTTARSTAVDIVFVVDDSESMADKIDTVRNELATFQTELESQGVDSRYAVVTVTEDVVIEQRFSPSVSETQNTLDQIATTGAEEYNYRAIATAVALDSRDLAQRVVIDLTDEPTDRNTSTDPTQDELVQTLEETDTTFIAVSPDEAYLKTVTEHGSGPNFEGGNSPSLDKRVLAEKTSTGTWFNLLDGDFGEKFTDDIATEVTTISRTQRQAIRIDGGTITEVTFVVETAKLPEGTYDVTVTTINDTATATLEITG